MENPSSEEQTDYPRWVHPCTIMVIFTGELFTNWLHGDFSVPMWDLSVGMGMDVFACSDL